MITNIKQYWINIVFSFPTIFQKIYFQFVSLIFYTFLKKIINRFNDHLIFISNIPETFATIRLIKRFYRSYFSNYDYNYTKEYYENLYNYKKELENLGIQFYIVVFDYELEKKSNTILINLVLKTIFKNVSNKLVMVISFSNVVTKMASQQNKWLN